MIKEICNLSLCTGCAACANRCPKQCISMKVEGGLGHLYPKINYDECINCGACIKVCPSNSSAKLNKPITAYAGWDKNKEEYISSTSGGAASAFSRYIINHGGVVYGCSILQGIQIKHIRIDNIKDLIKLKGSKYVQSTIENNCYKHVKEDLKLGKQVLFIGTPCQIAGLKSFIGDNNDLLYTVDLICHGVPSLSYFQKHVLKKTGRRIPDEIYFRKNSSYLLLLVSNGIELYRSHLLKERYSDIYYNTFFDGFSYRESCYHCPYATSSRVSDVTIGDFWGLKDNLPIAHTNGCSVLLPLTEKGVELIKNISPDFYLFERTVKEAIDGNDQLKHPKQKDYRIKLFRHLHKYLGINLAYRLCVCDRIIKNFIKTINKH